MSCGQVLVFASSIHVFLFTCLPSSSLHFPHFLALLIHVLNNIILHLHRRSTLDSLLVDGSAASTIHLLSLVSGRDIRSNSAYQVQHLDSLHSKALNDAY